MPEATEKEKLSLLGEWNVKGATYNSITLDTCDYYFDGELIAKDGYVLDILPRINEKRRAVDLTQVYKFRADCSPSVIYLCTETPEIFDITLNGKKISGAVKGEFRDKSFKLLDIAGAVKAGENELVLKSTISQSEKTYEHLSQSWAFESMKNSLSYDIEIEPIYIVGDFGARLDAEKRNIDAVCYATAKLPVITEMPKTVIAEALAESGYPEFAGEITLERKISVDDVNKFVTLRGLGMNSVHISVNGKEAGVKLYAPYDVDISEYLKVGENTIEIKIVNNLRNMQGPLHLDANDGAWIGPASFFRESNVFRHEEGKGEDCHDVFADFTSDIRLVNFGLRD